MAKKIGRNKKKCDAYRMSGRLQINKAEKQKKALQRIEHFAKRREEGKAYEYTKPADEKEKRERARKQAKDQASKHDRKLPIQIWDSVYRKLQNGLDAQKLADKERERKSRK